MILYEILVELAKKGIIDDHNLLDKCNIISYTVHGMLMFYFSEKETLNKTEIKESFQKYISLVFKTSPN